MVCYRVRIPGDTKVAGATADGQVTTVLPGEYLVHVLQPKTETAQPLVRFVGADPACRDVHVPVDVAKRFGGELEGLRELGGGISSLTPKAFETNRVRALPGAPVPGAYI